MQFKQFRNNIIVLLKFESRGFLDAILVHTAEHRLHTAAHCVNFLRGCVSSSPVIQWLSQAISPTANGCGLKSALSTRAPIALPGQWPDIVLTHCRRKMESTQKSVKEMACHEVIYSNIDQKYRLCTLRPSFLYVQMYITSTKSIKTNEKNPIGGRFVVYY